MMFAHIHSTKEKLYGLFNLHVQLDFTIGGKIKDNKLVVAVAELTIEGTGEQVTIHYDGENYPGKKIDDVPNIVNNGKAAAMFDKHYK